MIKLVAIENQINPVNIQLNKTVGILDTHSLTPQKFEKPIRIQLYKGALKSKNLPHGRHQIIVRKHHLICHQSPDGLIPNKGAMPRLSRNAGIHSNMAVIE